MTTKTTKSGDLLIKTWEKLVDEGKIKMSDTKTTPVLMQTTVENGGTCALNIPEVSGYRQADAGRGAL